MFEKENESCSKSYYKSGFCYFGVKRWFTLLIVRKIFQPSER